MKLGRLGQVGALITLVLGLIAILHQSGSLPGVQVFAVEAVTPIEIEESSEKEGELGADVDQHMLQDVEGLPSLPGMSDASAGGLSQDGEAPPGTADGIAGGNGKVDKEAPPTPAGTAAGSAGSETQARDAEDVLLGEAQAGEEDGDLHDLDNAQAAGNASRSALPAQLGTSEEELNEETKEYFKWHKTNMCVKADPKECARPKSVPTLSDVEVASLRKRLLSTAERWGYHSTTFISFKGMRVLDVGMGQGPYGALAVGRAKVAKYTGIDPAICIDRPVCTRNKRLINTPTVAQCWQARAECRAEKLSTCPRFAACTRQLASKYKKFPFTGIQMMQAFPGKVNLLPGTFDQLRSSGLLKPGQHDVATMWMVTEHLPDNHLVVRGLFDLLDEGQGLCLQHHNYYGFGGHHSAPSSPRLYNPSQKVQRLVANWAHVHNLKSPVQRDKNLNRIRLGDLIAILARYFECNFKLSRGKSLGHLLKTKGSLGLLKRRGFSETELLAEVMTAKCARRRAPLSRIDVSRVAVHHPPLDGSYLPQPLPEGLGPGASVTHESENLKLPQCKMPR